MVIQTTVVEAGKPQFDQISNCWNYSFCFELRNDVLCIAKDTLYVSVSNEHALSDFDREKCARELLAERLRLYAAAL